jgi:hypothetical protein
MDERCENCEFVNRGVDDCCHMVFWVSDRCPLYKNLQMYRRINNHPHSIEWSTGLTGCRLFKVDEVYKQNMEEADRLNHERNERHAKEA